MSCYDNAREAYAKFNVDTEAALAALETIPVSLHCWQGDDVGGFEADAGGASGGILSTGNYPGKARTPQELRQDLDAAFGLIPGAKRLNLHAIYLDTPEHPDRDAIEPRHFQSWIDWAKSRQAGLDFNPTCFGHPKAASNLTLASPDPAIRDFWVEHVKACRRISAEMGRQLQNPCIMNIWIPDGFKDVTVDRLAARRRLADALDAALAETFPKTEMRDAVESKLFGIGVESCTVGSSEFYLAYALKHQLLLTLDSGHFHPTEVISDKISAVLLFLDEILLHVSRPVRWDSDHVVLFDDELQNIAHEIVNAGASRVHIGLDYFDGTINRIASWVIGTRNMQKALLKALLEPTELRNLEQAGNNSRKLMLLEELKMLPLGAVYDEFCARHQVPAGFDAMGTIESYERNVLDRR